MPMNRLRLRLSLYTAALAACLWVLAGGTALAQSGDLQGAVSTAIAHDAMLKNQPVTASVDRGVVTLNGTVETEQQRQQAETDAANVPGVSGIQNNITVSGASDQSQPAPPPPPDQSEQIPPPPPAESQPQSHAAEHRRGCPRRLRRISSKLLRPQRVRLIPRVDTASSLTASSLMAAMATILRRSGPAGR